jgi:hypothetical protein
MYLLPLMIPIVLIAPLGASVLGYLSIFKDYSPIYIVYAVLAWFLSAAYISIFAKNIMVVFMKQIGSGFGWIWLASIPASIYFIVTAIFFDGTWGQFFYSIISGTIAKGYLRNFENQLNRKSFTGK